MRPDVPSLEMMEAATADLLRLAFIEIRFLSEELHDEASPQVVAARRKQVNAIADICHGLPGLLAPQRRRHLADGLRYLWRTSNAAKRRWLRSCWDQVGYDHGWLTQSRPELGTAAPED
ncbi:hypothetical protein [Dactylosporangium darangshiense]|uniref:CHAD domain-containing protein n=1 Tax=Dactylosporangium darangshiense TaxID=579108 RepID=A0ABP8DUH4_9ACTN